MLHLVAYDIGNSHRLRRVSKICEDYGVRMEKSVFECDLTDAQMGEFWMELCKVVNEEEDRVLDYCIGSIERRSIRRLGCTQKTADAREMLVL